MALEYRVRWRRDGRQVTTRIYQRSEAAWRKCKWIAALEAVRERTHLADMPAIVEGPTVQVREVGQWTDNEVQPAEPTEAECADAVEWAEIRAERTGWVPPDDDAATAGTGPPVSPAMHP